MQQPGCGAYRLLLVIIISLPFTGQAFAVEDASSPFEAGLVAFRTGEYETALRQFMAAREQGRHGPELEYNLGATLFRLERFDAAGEAFRRLLEYPEWSDLARYNLGLVALRQSRTGDAEAHFRAVTNTGNTRLKRLAATQLDKLEATDTSPETREKPARAFMLFNIAAGHDSNVVSTPTSLQQGASNAADEFVDVLVFGSVPAAGNRDAGLQLSGYALTRQYHEFDSFDSGSYGASLQHRLPLEEGRFTAGADVALMTVGSEHVAMMTGFEFEWRGELESSVYRISYRPRWFDAGDAYSQVDGQQQRLDASWQYETQGGWKWRAAYRLESNDRADLQTSSGEFFSYSPTRNRLGLRLRSPRSGNWRWSAELMSEASRHDDANTLTDVDGRRKTAQRETDALEAQLRGEYRLSRHWQLFGEVSAETVDDTFELYSYDRRMLRIGLEFISW